MKQLFTLITLLATLALFADEGKAVFEAKCKACHTLNPPAGMHKPGTPEFEKAINALKAPPMSKIAQMAKSVHGDKEAFVRYVVDFITNPHPSKSVCMKKAIEGFGLMPAIGKTMSEKEKKAVALWMYELKADNCTRSMKCGAGKCGGGKCGAKEGKPFNAPKHGGCGCHKNKNQDKCDR